jgi:hypothetical protein
MEMSTIQVLTIIVANLALMITMFGITISLHISTDNKFTSLIQAIQAEMKDFHGRLCAIEERNKEKK